MCYRDHTDFSESTDEIAPLTEEEKKAKLENLRKKLMEKRANQSIADKEEAKRNEVRWSTLIFQPTVANLAPSKFARRPPRNLRT